MRQADGMEELDRRLTALCRERGPLRAVLARIACRLVYGRTWERLSYARLSDYAMECLGLAGRSVQSLALVGARFRDFPGLEDALVSGTLGWTKVRLLASLPRSEDETRWIDYARRVTAARLAKSVRAVDRGAVEAGAADEATRRSRLFEVHCSREVRRKWAAVRHAASRAAGRMVSIPEAAELLAAEVLSAVPADGLADEEEQEACEADGSWSGEREPDEEPVGWELPSRGAPRGEGARAAGPPWQPEGVLAPLVEGLDEADAFEVDLRFRRALALEQRLDARIGRLLALAWMSRIHRELGCVTREAYVRERLGMDPTRARALVRLERAAVHSEPFARAYRAGALSWVKAGLLAPLVSADPDGRFIGEWVAWAERVTVRRLREDVEEALLVEETDRGAFLQDGGLPPEARRDREIGAQPSTPEGVHQRGADREIRARPRNREGVHHPGADREIGAPPRDPEGGHNRGPDPGGGWGGWPRAAFPRHIGASPGDWEEPPTGRPGWRPPRSAPQETCWVRFIGPADIVQLLHAVLCTVRRRIERETGTLPTAGEALGAMIDHAFAIWDPDDGKVPARHRVFARDGWRCAVPGCTSMRNLHDHHIRFRSAGGSDAPENRITLCCYHHLRGVHSGLLRCIGRAPDGITWQLGIRAGVSPRLTYCSGDIRVAAPVS